MKRKIVQGLERLIRSMGFEVETYRIPKKQDNSDALNLNIGAGTYVIPGFESLDIYTPHYYKSKEAFLKERVEYDIRSDDIPYADASVDNIYINHVIEHIETEHIERFFAEAFRVLKTGAVLRIGCPDAAFLYQVSRFENEYWTWRKPWFRKSMQDGNDTVSQFDAMMGMLATQRLAGGKNSVPDLQVSEDDVDADDYTALAKLLRSDTHFRPEFPGDHINNWDFDRIYKMGTSAGFRHIIQSKPKGSLSAAMQNQRFDRNHNHMSLYVDLLK